MSISEHSGLGQSSLAKLCEPCVFLQQYLSHYCACLIGPHGKLEAEKKHIQISLLKLEEMFLRLHAAHLPNCVKQSYLIILSFKYLHILYFDLTYHGTDEKYYF